MHLRKIFLVVLLFTALTLHAAQAKNIIWVIGDGMGLDAMGFWMQGARYGQLEKYPSRTSNLEKLMNQAKWGLFFNNTYDTVVTDSAASATQMATGKWSRPKFIGVDYEQTPAQTLLELARSKGKAVGLVTDSYLTDATPAAFAAHVTSRKKKEAIAQQMIDFGPEVMLGGGLKYFSQGENKQLLKQAQKKGYQVVKTQPELQKITSGNILGLFADKGMPMAVETYRYPHTPTLTQMTQKALEILAQNENGFILMTEAGKIDWAAHANDPGALFHEMQAFDELIGYLKAYVEEHPDTLLYVNADHDTGLGGFVARSLDTSQVAWKAAQGEVLYNGTVDYGSFKAYKRFEQQKRNLSDVSGELKTWPLEKRKSPAMGRFLSDALGYEVKTEDFQPVGSVNAVLSELNVQRGVSYATSSHSALPIVSIAYGPGAEEFTGIYHNTQIFPRMVRILGWSEEEVQ